MWSLFHYLLRFKGLSVKDAGQQSEIGDSIRFCWKLPEALDVIKDGVDSDITYRQLPNMTYIQYTQTVVMLQVIT